ncbi:MAG: hypothetical protein J5517_03840 [Eubacterium sp.]|nr:hypothetical protein [Eubacterium sp.]
MKNRIRRSTVAFIMAAMIIAAGLGGCGQVEETEIPTEETVQEEVTEEAVTEEATESSEQEETSEVQEESEESEAQNYDENEAEKIDWAAIWPDISQASEIEHLKDADICIEDYRYFVNSNDREDILLTYKYQEIILDDASRKAFPKLADTIDKYNLGKGESKNKFFLKNHTNARKEKYIKSHNYETFNGEKNVLLSRVDDQVFSFVEIYSTYKGESIDTYFSSGVNLDPNTGEMIRFSDVIADEDKLIETIYEKLDEQDPGIRGNSDNADSSVVNYIKGENEEDIYWVMRPYGITIFFNPGVIVPRIMGPLEVSVTYLDNPELFTDKYTAENGNWAISLKEAYIDVNGDGKSDHIYWEDDYEDEDGGDSSYITGISIYVNDKKYSFDYNDYSNDIASTFIKNCNDYYMYVKTTQASDMVYTYVYKLSGSEVTYVGEQDGVIYKGCIYDPEHFYVSHTLFLVQVIYGIKKVKIGDDGLYSNLDKYFTVSEKSSKEITVKTDINVKEVDEAENVGTEKTLPSGVIFKIFRSDYETFADCVLEDGSLFRLEMEKSDSDSYWPNMTNGKGLWEVLEAEEY